MLQFITNSKSKKSPVEQIHDTIEGGCRWIQIRLKDASDEEIKKIFFEIRDKAKETLTTIILNDRVELAKDLGEEGVAGVHLGRMDMNPSEARSLLGPNAIIGVTAHNFEEIDAVRNLDIDYIGIGPYAFTTTKSDLASVLGIDGISSIMDKVRNKEIFIPCVAVGGITTSDIPGLIKSGINGIAVSGAIANANDIRIETEKFLSLLPLPE